MAAKVERILLALNTFQVCVHSDLPYTKNCTAKTDDAALKRQVEWSMYVCNMYVQVEREFA